MDSFKVPTVVQMERYIYIHADQENNDVQVLILMVHFLILLDNGQGQVKKPRAVYSN